MPPLLELTRLRAANLEFSGVEFTDGKHHYRSTGKRIGYGGMGNVWIVERQGPDGVETVVAKTFREEFLFLLREDEQARRRFDHFERVIDHLGELEHPNVLPHLLMAPISDNYLLISPMAGQSMLSLVSVQPLSPRERIRLFIDALKGLHALHQRGVVHRDFTLNNVLTVGGDGGVPDSTMVFDFDLSVVPEMLAIEERSYSAYYQGRILGSPEFSIAPELLDEVLGVEEISPRVDVYAAGTALFALFSENSIYGDVPDLSGLFYRIAEGVVRRGESKISWPEAVPDAIRPVIRSCLEREPLLRFNDAGALLNALEGAYADLATTEKRSTKSRKVIDYVYTDVGLSDEERLTQRGHPSVSVEELKKIEGVLARHGYLLEKALGRVKGNAIFLAVPDPELVADGRFPEDNTYRKIVTAIDLTQKPADFAETWLGRIYPLLNRVRQGYLTALYKVFHEHDTQQLLLFSEYVADARFGGDLRPHDLTLEEVFGLGLIVALTISRLHENGLAHNNVRAESLVFKGHRDAGRVQSLFVGMVEPSFSPEAMGEDVRNLAGMLASLIRQSRIDALRSTARPLVDRLRDRLHKMAVGEARTVNIKAFIDILSDVLAVIEPNFDVVRTHGGSIAAYADLLVRHSLFNRLYAVDLASV